MQKAKRKASKLTDKEYYVEKNKRKAEKKAAAKALQEEVKEDVELNEVTIDEDDLLGSEKLSKGEESKNYSDLK